MEEPEGIDVVLSSPRAQYRARSRHQLVRREHSLRKSLLRTVVWYSPDIEPIRNHAAPDRRRTSPSCIGPAVQPWRLVSF